jgi:hypothetical protein
MRTYNYLLKTFSLIGVLFIAGTAFAQENSLVTTEILRRGNSVEHVAGVQADAETVSLAALAPPPDDSHKWFITLVQQHGCKPCAKLREKFLVALPRLLDRRRDAIVALREHQAQRISNRFSAAAA